jgi:hypothetical protein
MAEQSQLKDMTDRMFLAGVLMLKHKEYTGMIKQIITTFFHEHNGIKITFIQPEWYPICIRYSKIDPNLNILTLQKNYVFLIK